MQVYRFSVCRQCRQALSRQFHTSLPVARSTRSQKKYSPPSAGGRGWVRRPHLPPLVQRPLPLNYGPPKTRSPGPSVPSSPSPEAVQKLVLRHLSPWKSAFQTKSRLTALGLQPGEVEALLNEYARKIRHEISTEILTGDDPWSISHILGQESLNEHAIADRVLTMRLFEFAARPGLLIEGVGDVSMRVLSQANNAFDMRYPAEHFVLARRMRRKVILHVGPTNSGKTYNALRALATAKSGIYAGPLRLLAHEVWERLNRGSIRPHDADPAEAHLYARECNLITGEEQRIVSEFAPLSSCTVEMIHLYGRYSVCVIDEIQMIADPQRGHAWTAALLGVPADEVHLCGEEAAVPLITELMKETGDDLEVKYYKRLTPLVVSDKSLDGRWDQIQKGDCIVTFSRSSIFSLKRVVEEATGLRCAVAYGRLPPETRSEQAALFNDPNSGYDVMVASDAIGMGLNLKIKRVVFVQLSKFNGTRELPLSTSQIKQIGGRAGRFGEHGDPSSVGIVTCLNPNDLPKLAKSFTKQPKTLQSACLPFNLGILQRVAQFLPPSFSLRLLHSMLSVASRVGKNYSLPETEHKTTLLDTIDHYGSRLKLSERMQFAMAPTSWRSIDEFEIFIRFLQQYTKGAVVDLRKALRESGALETLEKVTEARLEHEKRSTESLGASTGYQVQTSSTLGVLEGLHKVVVTYAWLSFREPLSFEQREDAAKLKEETEKGIEFVLEGIADVGDLQKREAKSMRAIRAQSAKTKVDYRPKGVDIPRILRRAGLA